MGGSFSLGWLAPKEDLGPWGRSSHHHDRDPISLVLTEDVFERWGQVHEAKSRSRDVGMDSTALAMSTATSINTMELEVKESMKDAEERSDTICAASEKKLSPCPFQEQGGTTTSGLKLAGNPQQSTPDNATIPDKNAIGQEMISSPGASPGTGGGDGHGGSTIVDTPPAPLPLPVDQHDQISMQDNDPGTSSSSEMSIREVALNHGESGDLTAADGTIPGEETDLSFFDFVNEPSSALKDKSHDMSNTASSVSPFISDVEMDVAESIQLRVVTNMAKACVSKLPVVGSIITQSHPDDLDKDTTEADGTLEKCKKVGEFWTKKLDSQIDKVATKLNSDLDQLLLRAERIKERIPPPMQNPSCVTQYANVAACYSKNNLEVFKCQDVVKAFAKCVGQSEWPERKTHQN